MCMSSRNYKRYDIKFKIAPDSPLIDKPKIRRRGAGAFDCNSTQRNKPNEP